MVKKWYEKSLKEMKYNSTRMWGSYLGALVGLILHIFISHGGNFLGLLTFGFHIVYGVLYVIGGFLIGWGIHCLIRRLIK